MELVVVVEGGDVTLAFLQSGRALPGDGNYIVTIFMFH